MKNKNMYKGLAVLLILLLAVSAACAACYGKNICNKYQYPLGYCKSGAVKWCYVTSCSCMSPRYQYYYNKSCYCRR